MYQHILYYLFFLCMPLLTDLCLVHLRVWDEYLAQFIQINLLRVAVLVVDLKEGGEAARNLATEGATRTEALAHRPAAQIGADRARRGLQLLGRRLPRDAPARRPSRQAWG